MLTELTILNQMLAAKGIAPVTSLSSPHPTFLRAKAKLTVLAYEIQMTGWWFNRVRVTLAADDDGRVLVPASFVSVDGANPNDTYTQRGVYLYDTSTNTAVISKAVEVVGIDTLPIAELPPLMKSYLLAKAKYDFFTDDDGDAEKKRDYARDAAVAWARLHNEELKQSDVTARHSPAAMRVLSGVRSNSRRLLPGDGR